MEGYEIPNITLQQILTFLTIVETGGFAKAGLVMHMTQPAVSKSIAKLERELELQLFNRTTRQLSLTDEGQQLYDYWKKNTTKGIGLIQSLRHHQSASETEINIAITNTTLAGKYLWEYIEQFNKSFPNITINIDSDSMHVITAKLIDGDYDMVIVPDFQISTLEENNLQWKWAKKSPVKLLISNNNPLSKREWVRMTDLFDENFVTLNEDETPKYNQFLYDLFAPYGKMPHVTTIYRSDNAVKSIYRGLDGIFITDDYFDYDQTSDISKVSLEEHTNGVVCAFKPKSRNKYVAEFLKIFERTL